MNIWKFVNKELQLYRESCNFTSDELIFFNLRAKNKSLIEISLSMNVSERTASNLSRAVKNKILRVKELN